MCLSASVNLGYLDLNFSSANILEYAVLMTSISLSVTKVFSEFWMWTTSDFEMMYSVAKINLLYWVSYWSVSKPPDILFN